MKNSLFILFLFIVRLGFCQTPYYWAEGEKVFFDNNDTKYFITYSDETLKAYLERTNVQKEIMSQGAFKGTVEGRPPYWAYISSDLMDEISGGFPISYSSHNYKKTTEGKTNEFGISASFFVQLKSKDDTIKLKELCLQYDILIIGQIKYMDMWYELYNCSKDYSTWEIANIFYETEFFTESYPDIMPEFEYNPTGIKNTDDIASYIIGKEKNILKVFISSHDLNNSLEIYSLDGERINSIEINEYGMIECNLSNIKGFYIVVLNSQDKRIDIKKIFFE